MDLTLPQRRNIERTIEAYCVKTGRSRADLTAADAQHVAQTMGIHVYPNVIEAVEGVLGGN